MDLTLKKECESIIAELQKFSNNILHLGQEITDNRIELFELEINCELPDDFKYFVRQFNKFSLMGNEVFGIGPEFKDSSLDRVYHFEHNEVANKMPSIYVPFSNDGRGNHYCLDISRMSDIRKCPIVFWQWDINYETLDNVETCNESFCEWVKEVLIEWTLEDYNYDGSKK